MTSIRCKLGLHDMRKVATWCDPDCSVIFIEETCARCGQIEYYNLYFNEETCKVLTRIPCASMPIIQNDQVVWCDCACKKTAANKTNKK